MGRFRRIGRMTSSAAVLGLAVLLTGGGVALATGSGGWGSGEQVPGSGQLNAGGNAQISSVSCPSPGNCSAGGFITAKVLDHGAFDILSRAFVVSQRNGVWGQGEVVPGIVKLNKTGQSLVASVSCTSPGNCSAGGNYTDNIGDFNRAFVVDERNGRWGTSHELPGAGIRNPSGGSLLTSLSCPSAGNCVGAGALLDVKGQHAFVAVEHNGTWRAAFTVPGADALGTLGAIGNVWIDCPSAGNCTLAGQDGKTAGGSNVFVATERHGVWTKPLNVPGLAALNKGKSGLAFSLSCASAGNCAVGGNYDAGFGSIQAFVADQHNGTWSHALEVPGTASLNVDAAAAITSVSCPSAGNCSAGGYYNSNRGLRAFVVSQAHGAWGTARTVAGAPSTSYSQVLSISCVSAGNCNAGGYDQGSFPGGNLVPGQAFAVSEVGGHWGSAVANPSWRHNEIASLSCPRQNRCTAGGFFDKSGNSQAFVVSKS